ncbi:MAG: hypothetical protein HUK25_04190 [Treponema sp.]|nr:hypothetical protein [Clostridia bacterium]MCF0241811.1 hypothetical protein [Treponema sp.]
MKKFVSVIFLSLFIFINLFANPLIDEDCKYLETLFSEVAIDMSMSLEEKNMTSQDVVAEIKSVYKETASANEEKKEEINKKAFANAISKSYAKFSNKNGHVSVINGSSNDLFLPFNHQFIYFSEVYFSKENESYVVFEKYKNLKKGMRYTGNTDNLFKTIHNNQTLYRFGIFSEEIIKNTKVSVENKEYKVPVFGDTGSIKYRKEYEFKKIDNIVYLKIEKCNYLNEKQEKEFFDDSDKIIKEFYNADSIVFDFRNNLGGYSKYLEHFTYALIYSQKTKDNELEFNQWSRSLLAGEKKINTRTMIDKTMSVGLAPSNYYAYCIENLGTKYLEEIEYEEVKVIPQYKGKIYILINPLTSSVAEEFTLTLKKLLGQNVIIVGQNSYGSLDYADIYKYILPNSKIRINLCAVDLMNTILLSEESWHGDTLGVFPDFWCEPQDIVTTLSKLTGNENILDYIKL